MGVRFFSNIVLVIALAGAVYVFRAPLHGVYDQVFADALPCRTPIRYSIGTFDGRFNVTRPQLILDLQAAEKIWEDALGRNLFEYTAASSSLPINLVYDQRQATTAKLQQLDTVVDESTASYEAKRAQFETLRDDYLQERAAFTARANEFDAKQETYARTVKYWNDKGGAPQVEFDKLEAQKAALQAELGELKQVEQALNVKADQVNAMVDGLNKTARNLNLNVAAYNNVGRAVPTEFEEGMYTESFGSRQIDIYEFASQEKLIRVLAHEFGHALGLNHVSDPEAIMYEVNRGEGLAATAGDITALKARCGIQ